MDTAGSCSTCAAPPAALTHKHLPFVPTHSSVHPAPLQHHTPWALPVSLEGQQKLPVLSEPGCAGDLQTKPYESGGSGPPGVMDKPLASGVLRPPQEVLGWPFEDFRWDDDFCGDWRKMEQSNRDRAAAHHDGWQNHHQISDSALNLQLHHFSAPWGGTPIRCHLGHPSPPAMGTWGHCPKAPWEGPGPQLMPGG